MDGAVKTVNVEFQELANTSRELSTISQEMKTIMNKMSQIIQEIRNVWQDENGKAFVSRFETEVQSQFEKYYGTVEEYSTFIKSAHDAYVAHEQTTKTSVQGAQ